MRRLKWPAIVLLVAAAAAGAFMLWNNRPLSLPVARAEKNVPVRVFGVGTIEARVISKAAFEVGATLAEVLADHGDRVRKGDVLARLDPGEQAPRVAKARAALAIAEVNIGKSKALVARARAVLEQKHEASRRRQSLAGRNIVSEQTAEEALRDEAVAAADVSVAESEANVAVAALEDARAQLAFEEAMLAHRTLIAPFDALVVERHREPGDVVKAGDAILTLVDPSTYWGLSYVDEARAGNVALGMPVEARIRSRPLDTFQGQVVRIGLESDRANEERRIYVKGDNPPEKIFLGEQAEFWITTATLDSALLVPEAAVSGFDGRQGLVWTIETGRIARRKITFGHRTEDGRLEVADGLPEGAAVVTITGPGLREGRAAKAAEGAAP